MPRPPAQRRAGRIDIGPRCLGAICAAAILGVTGTGVGQFSGIRGPLAERAPDSGALLAVVRDAGADRSSRVDAALRLVEGAQTTDPIASIATALSDPAIDGTTKILLLEAIARTTAAPRSLFEPVAALVAAAGNADLPYIAPALGSFRTRDSARQLLGLTGPERPWPVRQAAFDALVRLSGRDDLGTDAAAWRAWLDSATILSESDWREQLATDQARRADRLAGELRETQQELTPVYRRLYGQIPAADRPRLLADMLRDQREEPRALGFQLAALELSSGQSLPVAVSEAAASLLTDPSPATRARAAVLLDQLARLEAGPAVIEALNLETDPEPAAALLAAAARWPSAVARAAILRWLGAGPATRPAASKAALALSRADMLNAPEDRATAAAALRVVPFEQLGTTELRLLVSIGTDEDRARVGDLVESPVASARLAAAQALSGRADFLGRLLRAASLDSDLFSTVADGAAAVSPTAETFAVVTSLPAPDQDVRRAGLLRVAGALQPADLLVVAKETEDPEFAALLLDRLPELAADTDAAGAESVAQSIQMLADLRLRLGQPDRALAALDLLDTVQTRFPSVPSEEAANLRTVAHLCLDRIDRAIDARGSTEAWLRGLELSKRQPHAGAIVAFIRARFARGFTPNQRVEFALLESQVAAFEEEQQTRLVGPPVPESEH